MTVQGRRPPASPCIGVCVIDESRALCTGCVRTLDEIAAWSSASDAFRLAVWAALPERAEAMGLAVRRIDWQGQHLLDEVETRFADMPGTFVAGVYGAVAEVSRGKDEPFVVERDASRLSLKTERAALQLDAAPYLTAFEIARTDRTPLIALAVPSGRAGAHGPTTLTDLGPDGDSVLSRDAGGRRFDLGLGRRAARFTIRCDAALSDLIAPHCGGPWPACLGDIGMAVLTASPVRVVETPCLRAEVDAVIPPPGGTSPDGPHTHLLPDHIAQGFDTPPTVPLPGGYVLSALFYPR